MIESNKDKFASFGYCIQCGTALQKDAKFCTNCGCPVLEEEDLVEKTNEQVTEESKSTDETEKIPLDGILTSETIVDHSNEETQQMQIPSVPDLPTIPQSNAFQGEETQRMQPTPSSFTVGNTAEMPVAETLKQTARQGVSYSAANTTSAKKSNGAKIALIIVGVVVVIAAVLAVAVFGFGLGSSSQNIKSETIEQPQEEQQIIVELANTYTTKFPSTNAITYPTFTFKYPSSWSVADELVTARGETVELTSSDGISVVYEHRAQSTSSSDSISLNNMEKVADAAFAPTAVQGSDYTDLGDFIVAKGILNVNGRDQGTCYALVPASAMHSTVDLDLRCGVPGFWYASTITFTSVSNNEISAQTEQEIIAILASFTEAKAATEPDDKNADNNEVTTISGDYVLPDSASRLYSESELKELTNYELYIARNEIFARHGRMFKNEDLQAYFNSKDWYNPTTPADQFDESVFNKYEKNNIETMAKIENSRDSKFIS